MKKIFSFFISLAILFLVSSALPSRAQEGEPEFVITWRSQSYTPSRFSGKVFPATRSPVIVSFEILENGKLVDLSEETIYWYLNDNLIEGRKGVQAASFFTGDTPGVTYDLRIQLNNFKDRGQILAQNVKIPVAEPQAVIEASFPRNLFSGSRITVNGEPYFFNIQSPDELKISWEVNGEAPSNLEKLNILDVGLTNFSSGDQVKVDLKIENPENFFEVAAKSISLISR